MILGVYRLLVGIEDLGEVDRFVRRWLKYRLQRIRQIADVNLADPGTWFNLHPPTRAWSRLAVLRSSR